MRKLLLLLSIPTLIGCGQKTKVDIPLVEYDYDLIETKINWNDVFLQEEDEYKVYFFSRTCYHCNQIKQDFLKYYFSYVEKVYVVEANEDTVYGNMSDLVGIDSIDDFYIFGTPFLINVKNWSINYYYFGSNAIKEYISKIIIL